MENSRTKTSQEIFIKGTVILTITTIIVKLSGFPFAFLIHRLIGPKGQSIYSLAYEIFALGLMVATAGLPVAVAKLVAESVAQKKYDEARQIRRLSTIIFTILGLIISVVMFFSARTIANKVIGVPNTYLPLIISAPAIFILGLTSSFRGYYNGLHDMVPTGVSQAIEAVSKLVLSLGLAYIVRYKALTEFESFGTIFGKVVDVPAGLAGTDLTNWLLAYISPYTASATMLGVTLSVLCGFIFLLLYSKFKRDPLPVGVGLPLKKTNKQIIKMIIIVAIPIALSSIASSASSTIDSMTIVKRVGVAISKSPEIMQETYSYLYPNGFSDFDELGLKIYGIYTNRAMAIFTLVTTFTSAFSTASLPLIAEAWVQRDRRKLNEQINDSFRLTSLLAMPATFLFITMGKPILTIAFGQSDDIDLAANMLAFLSIGLLVVALATPVNAILQGIDLSGVALITTILGTFVKFLSNYFLLAIPGISINVIPLGTILCYSLITFAGLFIIMKRTKVILNIKLIFVKPMLSGLICGVVTFLVYSTLAGENRFIPIHIRVRSLILLAISGIIGAIVYVLALWLMKGISKSDLLLLPFGKKIFKRLDK